MYKRARFDLRMISIKLKNEATPWVLCSEVHESDLEKICLGWHGIIDYTLGHRMV